MKRRGEAVRPPDQARAETEPSSSGGESIDRFLGDLLHDLRNLLSGLDNTLFRAPEADPEIREVTHREIQSLIYKTEAYLDRVRLRAGKYVLATGELDLPRLSRECGDKLGPFLRTRGVVWTLGETPATVVADRRSLEKILTILLLSSSKLTVEGDSITISLRPSGVRTALTVELGTSGEGWGPIPDPLDPGEDAAAAVDVPLARELARLQNGDLRWESGGGTSSGTIGRFVLELPSGGERRPNDRREASSDKLSILIVDDNVDSAKSLAMLLSMAGHEADVRHDGRSALAAVRSRAPDAALLDLGLPDMPGYDVGRSLRREFPALVIVAVSGRGDAEAREQSLAAGFDDHLLKPVDPAELLRVLSRGSRRETDLDHG